MLSELALESDGGSTLAPGKVEEDKLDPPPPLVLLPTPGKAAENKFDPPPH